MSEKMHSESADHEALTAEPNEADRVEFQESAKTPEVPDGSEKCVSKKKRTIAIFGACCAACIVLVVALVVAFSVPKMPDLIGAKPYDALVKLAEVIPEDQIAFQTQEEFPALPEKEGDYSQWVVVNQSVSNGASIGSGDTVTVTIKPEDEYMAQREQIIKTYIEKISDSDLDISYDDLGNTLLLTVKEHGEEEPYYPIGYREEELDFQSEIKSLATSLDTNAILFLYIGDWLQGIYVGLPPESPNSMQETSFAIVGAINEEAIVYSKENSTRALENHMLQQNSIGGNMTYKVIDSGHIYIVGTPKPGTSYQMDGGEIRDGQLIADSAALFTRANVTCTYLDGNGNTVKTYYGSPTSFIIDPSTGKYMP